MFVLLWIAECAEYDVKHRQVRIIVCMDAFGMMNRMTFRPLDKISQPGGCFDIGMLEYAKEIRNQQSNGNGLGSKTC